MLKILRQYSKIHNYLIHKKPIFLFTFWNTHLHLCKQRLGWDWPNVNKYIQYKYCKSLKFCVGFILQISHMNCFREIKYHRNILAVHCNNVTKAKPAEIKFQRIERSWGKPRKYKAFTSLYHAASINSRFPLLMSLDQGCMLVGDFLTENYYSNQVWHTVNQQILASMKFGVSQNKVIWRLLNLASPRGLSMQSTINVYFAGNKY